MKQNRMLCAAALSLLFGIAFPAFSLSLQQDERKDRNKDQEGTAKKAETQHQQPQQAKRTPPIDHSRQQVDRGQKDRTQQQQPKNDRPQPQSGANRDLRPDRSNNNAQHPDGFGKGRSQPGSDHQQKRPDINNRMGQGRQHDDRRQDNWRDHHNDWQERRARNWQSDHRTWEQRGGYHGYRIPEYRFGRNFGQGHWFRIHDLPVIVTGGYPRFLYGGYWFSLLDPWPEYWTEDWYETDDVYVVYSGDGYYLYNRRYPALGIAVSISM